MNPSDAKMFVSRFADVTVSSVSSVKVFEPEVVSERRLSIKREMSTTERMFVRDASAVLRSGCVIGRRSCQFDIDSSDKRHHPL